jgi:hypothetical protein
MILGIVGPEASKWTTATESKARRLIQQLLAALRLTHQLESVGIASGACHLGGVDIWAEEIAVAMNLERHIFPPTQNSWPYYKERNLKIIQEADEIHCITVAQLPPGYEGKRFPLCYHCRDTGHVESGGCWTMNQAKKMGKPGFLHVVSFELEREPFSNTTEIGGGYVAAEITREAIFGRSHE